MSLVEEIKAVAIGERQEVALKEFLSLKEDLIKKYDELGMRASGKWANNLTVNQTKLSTKLEGMNYTYWLVHGRKGGTLPPIEALKKWVVDKGIASELKEVTSIAWAVAKTIQKKGTRYYQQGGTDLIDSVITPQRMQSIIDKVGAGLVIKITPIFTKYISNE